MEAVLRTVLLSGARGFDPDAAALFARFTTPPTETRKSSINALILSLKAAGVWGRLDALYLTAAATAQAAQQNWIADRYTLSPVNAPVFTADRGYQGDGATSYLNTGFNPATAGGQFSRDSASAFSWVNQTSGGTSGLPTWGGMTTSASGALIQHTLGSNMGARLNQSASSFFGPQAGSPLGSRCVSRTGPATLDAQRDGVTIGTTATEASGALSSQTMALLRLTSTYNGRDRIACAAIGGGLSASDMSALDAAVRTYLHAVGAA